jgi:hypothetical protein
MYLLIRGRCAWCSVGLRRGLIMMDFEESLGSWIF